MFTQRTWVVLTEQINFARIIMLEGSRESGTNICLGFLLIWLPVTHILESESCVKHAQDLFRLELGKRLIGNFNSRKRPASDALPLVSRAPLTHISTKIKGRKRQCVNCKAKEKKTSKNYPIETKFVSTVQSCALSRPVFPRLPH